MKNIKKLKTKSLKDSIAEARKHPKFNQIAEEEEIKIRLAIRIYEARKKMGLSQQDLAKKTHTTQKVISKIEHGLVNIGIDLLQRIDKVLSLNIFRFNNTSSEDYNSPVCIGSGMCNIKQLIAAKGTKTLNGYENLNLEGNRVDSLIRYKNSNSK